MRAPTTPTGGLEGYSVVVTGGGTGLGRACATRLAADGAAVTICGRTEAKLIDAAAAANHAATLTPHGGTARHVVADVTDEDDVRRLIDTATQSTGALDGFVANAGGGGALAPIHMQTLEAFTQVLHLNVIGTLLCLKHAVPRLVAAGGGSFVGMSSIAGHMTHPYFGAYPIAKAGIEEMMRNAADEYGAAGVRANAIRPGFIATEIMEGIARDGATYRSYIDNTPLGDVGDPADVAALVRFLIGQESRWITGQVINIDGGHSLRRGPDFGPLLEPFLGRDAMLARTPPPSAPSATPARSAPSTPS